MTSISEVDKRALEKEIIPGEMGVWLFVLGDMILFSLLFVAYAIDYGKFHDMFRSSQAQLNQNFGLANTLLLLTGSVAVVISLEAMRHHRIKYVRYMLMVAILTGLLFWVNKIIEYTIEISAGNTMLTNQFFMYYYTLTAIHLLHVSVGIGVLTFLLHKLKGYNNHGEFTNHLESGGAIWHMVDLLWIALFPLLYLI